MKKWRLSQDNDVVYQLSELYGISTDVLSPIKGGLVNVIYEFETYRYRDKRPGVDISEKPVKENDHSMDAIRYTLTTYTPMLNTLEDQEEFNMYGTDFE